VRSVLRHHPEVHSATVFGSRTKGTHTSRSDVDLALAGPLGALGAEAIAAAGAH
jgi:predicted nucleotidyltransferase